MRDAETVTFGGSGLDRAAELRGDQAALNRLMQPVLESLDKEDAGAPGEEEPSLILQP